MGEVQEKPGTNFWVFPTSALVQVVVNFPGRDG